MTSALAYCCTCMLHHVLNRCVGMDVRVPKTLSYPIRHRLWITRRVDLYTQRLSFKGHFDCLRTRTKLLYSYQMCFSRLKEMFFMNLRGHQSRYPFYATAPTTVFAPGGKRQEKMDPALESVWPVRTPSNSPRGVMNAHMNAVWINCIDS